MDRDIHESRVALGEGLADLEARHGERITKLEATIDTAFRIYHWLLPVLISIAAIVVAIIK